MVFQNGLVKALLIKPFEPTMTNTNIRHDKRDVIWVIIPYVGSKSDALLQLLQRKVKLKFRITQATQKLSFYVNMKDHVPGMFSWKLAFESFSRGSKTFLAPALPEPCQGPWYKTFLFKQRLFQHTDVIDSDWIIPLVKETLHIKLRSIKRIAAI